MAHDSPVPTVTRVWLEGWQVACCGTTFEIGSHVDWEAGSERGGSFLRRVLGDDLASSIDFIEDHHGQIDDRVEVTGEVVNITAAFCRYAPSAEGGLAPVAGTTRTEARSVVHPEEDGVDGLMFVGYVVDVRRLSRSAVRHAA